MTYRAEASLLEIGIEAEPGGGGGSSWLEAIARAISECDVKSQEKTI